MPEEKKLPIIDYEGSDYQSRFWDTGEREYEDRCEAIALKSLLPLHGNLMLELGAGAGRNTNRYLGFERIVLLDYSGSQLKQAQERLGNGEKYIFVAADIYHLPFIDGLFPAATMIRTLHHMSDAPEALRQVKSVLQPGATFILEFANKQNFKAILRHALHRQSWSPFDKDPVEFAPLNFDFHPVSVRNWLKDIGFRIDKILAVSHFRVEFLKKAIPAKILAGFDSMLQWTGAFWQLTPSVFIKAICGDGKPRQIPQNPVDFFKCPKCGHNPLKDEKSHLCCVQCGSIWKVENGIYDFRGAGS